MSFYKGWVILLLWGTVISGALARTQIPLGLEAPPTWPAAAQTKPPASAQPWQETLRQRWQPVQQKLGEAVKITSQTAKKTAISTGHWADQTTPIGLRPPGLPRPDWVEGVLVVPVYKTGGQRAFRDAAELVAQALSRQLAANLSSVAVLGPVEWGSSPQASDVEDALSSLDNDWRRYGHPAPVTLVALQTATAPLFAKGANIRVVIVDAEVSLSDPARPSRLGDRVKAVLTDSLPQTANYHLRSKVHVVDGTSPAHPWLGQLDKQVLIEGNQLMSLTASVLTLEGTAQQFRGASDRLAVQLLRSLPTGWMVQSPGIPTPAAESPY